METNNELMLRAYLAFPYSHPNPRVRAERVKANARLARQLWLNGYYPVSGGVYWHLLLDACDEDPGVYPTEHFRNGNFSDIASCQLTIAQLLTGWKESKGMKDELAFSFKKNLPVFIGRLVLGEERRPTPAGGIIKDHQLLPVDASFFRKEAGWRFE